MRTRSSPLALSGTGPSHTVKATPPPAVSTGAGLAPGNPQCDWLRDACDPGGRANQNHRAASALKPKTSLPAHPGGSEGCGPRASHPTSPHPTPRPAPLARTSLMMRPPKATEEVPRGAEHGNRSSPQHLDAAVPERSATRVSRHRHQRSSFVARASLGWAPTPCNSRSPG